MPSESRPSESTGDGLATPYLRVHDLRKEYPTRAEPLVLLRGVAIDLGAGDAIAVMGPSGSGKSTLLHVVGTLEPPTYGTVHIQGVDPFKLSPRKLAEFRRQHLGFVFQDHHLLPQCSALENVLVPLYADRHADASHAARAEELLRRVGLSNRMQHRPAELSGGERQRVAIARALVFRPGLILADEPTGNLDRKTAESVAELFLELHREQGMALIVVTHSIELAERFPRRVELVDGLLSERSCG